MATSGELKELKVKYEALRETISAMAGEVASCSDKANAATVSLENNFKIDDSVADSGKLAKIADDIANQSSYITTTVLPAIDNKIAELNTAIGEAEAAEAAAEEAARQEAAKVEEASKTTTTTATTTQSAPKTSTTSIKSTNNTTAALK